MDRELSAQEYAVCAAMIACAQDTDHSITSAQRRHWQTVLDETTVCGVCGCGQCPSVGFAYRGVPVDDDGPSVVLNAETAEAMVMLFIDAGKLSYLEIAPLDVEEIVPMPTATDLIFY